MAGHSQFKNIMHRKGAQDAKRAKQFTKIAREITAAVRGGDADPANNPRLRSAITAARQANMPKDRIERAIAQASGSGDADNYEEIRYEGYGVNGVAVIVEALTDNRNRTASDVRSIFSKHGGNLGETGSVSFMFSRVGLIAYPVGKVSEEEMLEAAIEAGADNCESSIEGHEITCEPESFAAVHEALTEKLGEPESAKITWVPTTTTELNEEQAQTVMKMIDALEDNDDVQQVCANFEIPEAVAQKLVGAA